MVKCFIWPYPIYYQIAFVWCVHFVVLCNAYHVIHIFPIYSTVNISKYDLISPIQNTSIAYRHKQVNLIVKKMDVQIDFIEQLNSNTFQN